MGFTLVVFALLMPGHSLAASVDVQLGEPLRTALDRYVRIGFNVVSTTRILPPRLTVTLIPDPDQAAAAQVRALLRPHGLDLKLIDAGNGYVVELDPQSADATTAPERLLPDQQPVEEIIVTSQYRLRRREDNQHTLEHEGLLSLPSLGRDMLRGLDVLPGVSSSGISARQRFRGGDVNEVLYRLDGVELLEPFHMRSLQELFSAINLNVVDSADVYVAGFPVSMGARMSGVVDLVPLEPTKQFQGGIDLNQITANVDASGWRDNWSWLASARRSLLEYSLDLFNTDYGEPRFDDQFARIVRDGTNSRLILGLLNSTDRITVRDDAEYGRSHADYRAGWIRWEHTHSANLGSQWQISGVSIDNTRSGTIDAPDFSIGDLIERRRFQTVDLRNDWQWRVAERTELHAGWGVAFKDGEFEAQLSAQFGPVGQAIQDAPTRQRALTEDRTGESMAAYLSLHRQLSQHLNAEIGLRYDGQDIDPVHVNEISARGNLEYRHSPTLKFALNVGRYTQQQHLYEIQIDDGKAELDPPQHSDQANLTAMWQPWQNARLRLDLYYPQDPQPRGRTSRIFIIAGCCYQSCGRDRFEIAPRNARRQRG